jgi:hypothetical protein
MEKRIVTAPKKIEKSKIHGTEKEELWQHYESTSA